MHNPNFPHFPDPPLAVGLCLAEEALPSPTEPLPLSDSPAHSPSFVRNIMHRPVPPRPFVAHVKYDASAASIAAAFRLPEPHVKALWLPSPPSSLSLSASHFLNSPAHHLHQQQQRERERDQPVSRNYNTRRQHGTRRANHPRHAAALPESPHKRASTSRFTPQSVQDAAMLPAAATAPHPQSPHPNAAAHRPQHAPPAPPPQLHAARAALSDARRKARRAGLSSQYASLFAAAGTADERALHFASALAGRLRTLVQPTGPPDEAAADTAESGAAAPPASAVTAAAGRSPRRVRPAPPRCGLSELRAHADIALLCARRAARKERAGLYRAACSEAGVARRGVPGWRYFEAVVVDDGGAGGVCVGVGTLDIALNRMVGGDARSIALHSSGQIVRGGGAFERHGRAFGAGDRVGCAVRQTDCGAGVAVVFFVNGERQGDAPVVQHIWRGLDEPECMAFAAVSLYKKDCKVVLVCCAGEWAVEEDVLRAHLGDEIWSICGGSGESSSSGSEGEDDLFHTDSAE